MGEGMAELAPGDKAPAFALLDQHGNKVKLTDFRGGKLLVYYCPRAGTSDCARQA